MKRKKFVLIALSALMAATFATGILTACGENNDESKPSEYSEEDGINYYYGDGKDVHLQGWITSTDNAAWTVEEGYTDTETAGSPVVTKLGYSKNDAWRNFGVKIDGRYSDFAYLNVTMRAKTRGNSTRPVTVNMKIVNPITGKDDMNVLGSDLYFDVSSEEYVTYTFAIPHTYLQLMDVVTDVCLFPDPGIANSDTIYAGDIYVKDMWFSKTAPEDGYTPVDDTWRTEAWCDYDVVRGGGNEAVVSFNGVNDWARFYRPVPLEELGENNMLRLQFTSDTITLGDVTYEDSIEHFQLGFFGDPQSDGMYYQAWFGQYCRDGFSNGSHSNNDTVMKVEKDEETGVITLTCQVAPLLMDAGLAGHYDQQLWLLFNVECQPEYVHENVPFDRIGQMTILSSEFYFDEDQPLVEEPVVNESGWSGTSPNYVISSEKSGVVANVTYENIGYQTWTVLAYDAQGKESEAKTVTLTLRNNGENDIHIRARLDKADSTPASGDSDVTIAPGETKDVIIPAYDAYRTIVVFLDSHNFAGGADGESYSGDMDIVSVEFSDEAVEEPVAPDTVNGWGIVDSGKSCYTISEKEGALANVSYQNVPKELWANLYRDVTASERGNTVRLTLRNNGTQRVLYGAELGSEASRKYGWIEAGETVTVKLTNPEEYYVINLFLDCCYFGGDYVIDQATLSGDVDIVSVEFSDEEVKPAGPESVNGWSVVASGRQYYTLAEKERAEVNITYEGLPKNAWANFSREVSDSERRNTANIVLRNNGTERVLYAIEIDSDATRRYGFIYPGRTVSISFITDEPYHVINLFLDCCYYGAPYDTDRATLSGDVDIVEVKFFDTVIEPEAPNAANGWGVVPGGNSYYQISEKEDVVANIVYTDVPKDAWTNLYRDVAASERTNTVKLTVRNNGSEKVLFGAELGSDASRQYAWIEAGQTVTVTLHSGEAYNVINFFLDCCYYGGEYDTEHATLSGDVDIVSLEFTNEQGGDPDQPSEDPDQPNEANGWGVVSAGSAYYQISEKDGVLANVAYENVPKALWVNLYRDVTDGERKSVVKLTLRNNGGEKLLVGIDLDSAADRQYAWIEAGQTVTVTLHSDAAYNVINFFLDCCYYGGEYDTEHATLTGELDIVSLEFTDEQGTDPDQPSEDPDQPNEANGWKVVESGSAYYQISEKDGVLASVVYTDVPSGLWANLYRDVTDAERKSVVKLTLRNNGEQRVLVGVELGSEATRQYVWIEAGETIDVELKNSDAYTVISMFLDCCYHSEAPEYAPVQEKMSGDVDIVSLEFIDEPAEPDDGYVWGGDAANLSVSGKTVTLHDLPIGAWQNINTGISLEAKPVKLTLPVTNGTDHVVKFKLSVQDESWQQIGSDSDPSVVWLEIPVGETWDFVLSLTAEQAGAAKHLMLMIDCWTEGSTVGSTGEACPAGPYNGTVVIGNIKVESTATDVQVSWQTDKPEQVSINGEEISYSGIALGDWVGANGAVTLGAGQTSIALTVRNDGDHAIRIHASARPSDWSAEFGTLRTIVGVGETAVITLALSEEEAAKTGIVVLFLDCWESYMDDYASRPQDEQGGDLTSLSGKITILGVQTY